MILFSRLKEFDHLKHKGVKLLAVSKGQSVNSIRALAEEGQIDFGESRLQEGLMKLTALKDLTQIKWHFIGQLQSNKVRGVVKAFDFIHSVDSLKLAKRISRIALEEGKEPIVMFQVKLMEDANKTGFFKDHLLEVWSELIELPNIKVTGLMAIAPIELEVNKRKTLFKDCRILADKLELKDCSMGMSRDWEEAVEAGSTWIRLGSILFGEHHK